MGRSFSGDLRADKEFGTGDLRGVTDDKRGGPEDTRGVREDRQAVTKHPRGVPEDPWGILIGRGEHFRSDGLLRLDVVPSARSVLVAEFTREVPAEK